MAIAIGNNRSKLVAYLALFTALVTVFDVVPIIPGLYSGVWDSWIFILSPIIGVLLGPFLGFISVGLGSLLGHFIYYRDPFEFLFMLGAAIGAASAALIYQKRWRPVLIVYSGMLIGYFVVPVSWFLPLIGIWDILLGFVLLLLFILIVLRNWWPRSNRQEQWIRLLFCAIIGLEVDILFRVFVLVPGHTFWFFYGWTIEFLQIIWLTAGIITPTKVVLATLFTITIGFSLLQILPRLGILLSEAPENSEKETPPAEVDDPS